MSFFSKMMNEEMGKYVESDKQATMAAYVAMMKPPEYGESHRRMWWDIYSPVPKVNDGPFYMRPEYQRREKPMLKPFPFELRVTASEKNRWTNFSFTWVDDWGENLHWQIQIPWRELDWSTNVDMHITMIFERFYRAMDSARIY